MSRPKLLDLFCCQGGAGMGYHRAGFDVYGIDIEAQPRYPFAFQRRDALDALRTLIHGNGIVFERAGGRLEVLSLRDFAAIHASPPCQGYSVTRVTHNNEHPMLIPDTRELLDATGLPYIIENVEGALPHMRDPMLLCGSMFGLGANDTDGTRLALRRHRLFESNIWLMSAGGCIHDATQVAGVYGGSRYRNVAQRDAPSRRGGYTPDAKISADLLGIDWMTKHGLNQSIPPAYCEFIGAQLLEHLEWEAA